MDKIINYLKKLPPRLYVTGLVIVVFYLLLGRIDLINGSGPDILNDVWYAYLGVSTAIANQIFQWSGGEVLMEGLDFVFKSNPGYEESKEYFLIYWPHFLLYRNWILMILFLVWATNGKMVRKIVFSIIFLIWHLLAVIGGLIFIGLIGPAIYQVNPLLYVSPTTLGTYLMFLYFAFWMKSHVNEIQTTFARLSINIQLSNKTATQFLLGILSLLIFRSFISLSFYIGALGVFIIWSVWILRKRDVIRAFIQNIGIKQTPSDRSFYEVLCIALIFLILQGFIIPNFDFEPYVYFLLKITQATTSFFVAESNISGDFLLGPNGSIEVGKGCYGFLTMLVFASLIFLTRDKNWKKTSLFIVSGILLLILLNVIRFSLLFVMIQGEESAEVAYNHHEAYNIVIYTFIFILWVIWFEYILPGKRKKVHSMKEGV